MRRGRKKEKRVGSSLVEVVVVLAIYLVVMSLSLPAIQRVRAAADTTRCQVHMKQIGTALHSYHADHDRLPGRGQLFPSQGGIENVSCVTWRALLLPYLEYDALWRTVEPACWAEADSTVSPPHVAHTTVIPVYGCPSDEQARQVYVTPWGHAGAVTNYLGVIGGRRGDGLFGLGHPYKFSQIGDGASYTLAVGERPVPLAGQAAWWYSGIVDSKWPNSYEYSPSGGLTMELPHPLGGPPIAWFHRGTIDHPNHRLHFWSFHPGGGNFLFAGGNVRYFPYSAHEILIQLATINGGEPVPDLD